MGDDQSYWGDDSAVSSYPSGDPSHDNVVQSSYGDGSDAIPTKAGGDDQPVGLLDRWGSMCYSVDENGYSNCQWIGPHHTLQSSAQADCDAHGVAVPSHAGKAVTYRLDGG